MRIPLHSFLLITLVASSAFGQSKELKEAYSQYVAYYQQGDYTSAVILAEKALALTEKEFGKDHEIYATHLNNLAFFFASSGRYKEAEPFFQQALAIQEKVLHGEHPNVVQSLKNLAELYRTQGRYAEAESFYQRVLIVREKVLGREHPEIAPILNILAGLYDAQGRYEEAEPLYQRVLAIREKMPGGTHQDVAQSLNNLAHVYEAQARYTEAKRLYQRALGILEIVLDGEHPDIATSLNNLAALYFVQGCLGEAEPLYQRALAIQEKMLENEHPDIANSLNNLATLYHAQGRYEEAAPLYQRALGIWEKALGGEHPDVATSLNNLAELYLDQGRYREAEPLYERALAIREKVLGREHPDVAYSLNSLSGLYRVYGRYREVESLLQRALKIRETALGGEHPDVANSLNNLAALYRTLGRYTQAEPLYQRALASLEKTLGLEHPSVANILNNFAELYRTQDRYREAEPLHQRALAIREKTLGMEHPEVGRSLNNLALVYSAQGRYREAVPLHQRALSIKEQALGGEHPDVATSLNNLAFLHHVQGQDLEADRLFKRANANLLHQIRTCFPFMSEADREQFYQTIDFAFELFNSFAIKRANEQPTIINDAYNNQLAVKALLLNSTAKVKRLITSSGDRDLITLYRNWIKQREYLAKVYILSKVEIVQQGINKDSLDAATNMIEKQLSVSSGTFAQANDTALFTWRDVQKKLQPNEATVEIVRFKWYRNAWTDTVYYAALIVTPQAQDHPELVLLENGNDLESKYYREYLRCRQMKNGVAYQQYWQPIKEKLNGITKVYFAPDGIYNQMNLNILSNPETGVYILNEIDLHLVTSTRELLQFGKKKLGTLQAQLFGRPAYQLETEQLSVVAKSFPKRGEETWLSDQESTERRKASFSDLPGTEKEVTDIGLLLERNGWQATVYTGRDAVEEAVKAVKNPEILHIATHGFFMKSDVEDFHRRIRNLTPIFTKESYLIAPSGTDAMLRSGLLLTGAATFLNSEKKPETEDGILTAYEAANLDLDNTELVVLSACETGLGEVKNGEGVYGLQRAFRVSGAKTILMSLWKVDDTATQELMTSFYDIWLRNGNKRQAFRKAQQQICDRYKLPEFWGAFVMVGE